MKQNIKLLRRNEIPKNIDLPLNLPPLLRKIYASRGVRSSAELSRSLKQMLPWKQLSGIESAVNMLYDILCINAKTVVVGDFDVDGATSTALSILCLRQMGHDNVSYMVPNRFRDGYGLSPEIVTRLHSCGVQFIMTVDNGIASHAGIEHAYQLGISVLLTDHHLPGKTLPNAAVVVNPNVHNCDFPFKSLAGVGIVFYLMLALRAFLREKGWFASRSIAIPNLAEYLDLVALGTVADAVPLDANNRILVWQGLNRIRAGKCRPGILALLNISNREVRTLEASDLGFYLAPRLNAAGRLDDMSVGIAILLCDNFDEACLIARKLDTLNQKRKEIEKKMRFEALSLCNNLLFSNDTPPSGFIIYRSEWHVGIIGTLASYIQEYFYRPVIAFSQINNGILKGSGRSIHGLHMYNVLEHLDTLYPGLIIKFGGHAMAVGLLLKEESFDEFQYRFLGALTEYLDSSLLQRIIFSDGALSPEEMTMEVAQMLRDAGPWGKMFPEPLFDGRFRLLHQQIVNSCHLKIIVEPIDGGPLLDGVVFNIDTSIWPNNDIRNVELVYKLNINEFRGNRNLQIIISNIFPF